MIELTMLVPYSTLPADETALRPLIDRLRGEAPRGAVRAPALPFSPLPGSGDAGWIATTGGMPCASAWIRRQTGKRALIEIDASPADLAGVFSTLLEFCIRQGREWGCARLVTYVPEVDESLAGLYSDAGFTAAGAVCDLHTESSGSGAVPAVPAGYFLKAYTELRHLPTLAALLHRAYHDRFSRPEFETDGVTVDIVRTELEAQPGIEADTFILLNDYGKGVGVVRCRGVDWIDAPGIVPEERGKGLHFPLLAAARQRLAAQGSRSAWMMAYDEAPAVIADYVAAGFTETGTRPCWQMELK